jgi:ankyrin repeat protein
VVKLLLETKSGYGQTPLSWAIWYRHKVVVKLLLEKGVELETISGCGQTPLSWAAWYGHEAVVRLLLEKNAKLETVWAQGGW